MSNSIIRKVGIILILSTLVSTSLFAVIFSVINTERVEQDPGVNASIVTANYLDPDGTTHTLDLELALTDSDKATGLMNRTYLEAGTGMLFIFDQPQPLTFWMKNTLISLDIIFLDAELKVTNIHKYTIPNQTAQTYSATTPAQYVIETNAGWADQVQLSPGDQIFIQK